MASKTVKVLTLPKVRNSETEFGCAVIDEKSKIWVVILLNTPQTVRQKFVVGQFLILHNVMVTYMAIKVTDQSRVGSFAYVSSILPPPLFVCKQGFVFFTSIAFLSACHASASEQ